MKRLVIATGMIVLLAGMASAGTDFKAGNVPLDNYTIVYQADADIDEGSVAALGLQSSLKDVTGIELPVKSDNEFRNGNAISIVKTSGGNTFGYSVDISKGKVVIKAGCRWAMDRGAGLLAEYLRKNPSIESLSFTGSVEGEYLFPPMDGATLRILEDNIWDYSADTIPEVWLKAGIDCRDSVRAPEFAQIVRAYMPDVLALQEYSGHMHAEFYPRIEKYGYRMAYKCADDAWNHTPVFYNHRVLKLLKVRYNRYTPSMWCNNNGSKSYTSAVFKDKSTGKVFAIINTHLWFRSDKLRPGSTQARAAQVRLVMAEAEVLRAQYDCPVFVTGDMNCEEETVPMAQFFSEGYVPCYKAATVYGNTDCGHHQCGDNVVGSRKSNRHGADRQTGAIDHCLIYNQGEAEVKVFDCIQSYFIVKLTDHYPNLIDVAL